MTIWLDVKEKVESRVLWMAILLLLIRLSYGIGVFLVPSIRMNLFGFYRILTYLLIVVFIVSEHDMLSRYHFDRLAMVIILVIKPIMSIYHLFNIINGDPQYIMESELFVNGFIIVVALLGLSQLSRKGGFSQSIPFSGQWLVIGFVVGLGTALVMVGMEKWAGFETGLQMSWGHVPQALAIQLTNAAVQEEAVFRGILWGVMKNMAIKEKWIWMIQALLFLVCHLYYLPHSSVIWLRILVAGLAYGAVVWRSRTQSASMVTHAAANTFAQWFSSVL